MKPIAQHLTIFGVKLAFFKWIDSPYRQEGNVLSTPDKNERHIHLAVQSNYDTASISMDEAQYVAFSTCDGTPVSQIDPTYIKKEVISYFEFKDSLRELKGRPPKPRNERTVMHTIEELFDSIDAWQDL